MTPQAPLQMRISLNVLEHLGINLYSNIPAVLAEAVANAWDADAGTVRITLSKNGEIVIADDGIGMTRDDLDKRFLTVGYHRRDEQPGLTVRRRSPMGRKGIGKLSLFSIADLIRVETTKNGESNGFEMSLPKIREQIERKDGTGTYTTDPLTLSSEPRQDGTKITLTKLRRRKTIQTTKWLKRRLARRFAVIGDDFRVLVDGERIGPADRGYYDKLQYLLTYGDQTAVTHQTKLAEGPKSRTAEIPAGLSVSGWLGTVRHARHLKDSEGDNLNRIAIFVRGKMAQEDILSEFSERGVYASYLIGELHVDGLDRYDGPDTEWDDDAMTSNRQGIIEDDQRYIELRTFIRRELRHVADCWTGLRRKAGTKKALVIPAVNEWINNLRPHVRDRAKRWIGRLNHIRVDDPEQQKEMIKHAVVAFEFYRVNENIDQLDNLSDVEVPAVLRICGEVDDLESVLYGEIVRQRIQVIRTLRRKIDENALERVIQQYIFEHLWLLDPAWERADGTEAMERQVGNLFAKVSATLTEEENRARLDIVYRKTAGQHVIVELKRPEVKVRVLDLLDRQIVRYHDGMSKILRDRGVRGGIEIVLLLGKEPQGWENSRRKQRETEHLRIQNTRVMLYGTLLDNARCIYSEYLRREQRAGRLSGVVRAIDEYDPQSAPEPTPR